jgi:hypothetical protein
VQTALTSGRICYQSTGGVDWGRFMPRVVPALGISAVLACAMFGLLVAGFFLVLIVPLFAGFAAGWAVRYAVARGTAGMRWWADCSGWRRGSLPSLAIIMWG